MQPDCKHDVICEFDNKKPEFVSDGGFPKENEFPNNEFPIGDKFSNNEFLTEDEFSNNEFPIGDELSSNELSSDGSSSDDSMVI